MMESLWRVTKKGSIIEKNSNCYIKDSAPENRDGLKKNWSIMDTYIHGAKNLDTNVNVYHIFKILWEVKNTKKFHVFFTIIK